MTNNNLKLDSIILEFEKPLEKLYSDASKILTKKTIDAKSQTRLNDLYKKINTTSKKIYKDLSPWDRTQVARHPNRPYFTDYIERIFTDFTELNGDRNYGNDQSTICGTALLNGKSVVLVGQQKGRTTEENLKRNFGMPQPEGYRKALRIFEFANKFKKPIITFIDTAGAFPGLEGEKRSQGEAIARNLKKMAGLTVPVISIIIGEGGSGGALGIGVANHVMMLENSIYSVISPESCASILWRDAEKKEIAAAALKNDAKTAEKFGIIDEIIPEPIGGAHRDWEQMSQNVKKAIEKSLSNLTKKTGSVLVAERIKKFSLMGETKNLKDK